MTKEKKFCPNHPEKSIYCKGLCRRCYEKQLLIINPNYKIRQQLNSRLWNEKNREHKQKYDKERRLKYPKSKDTLYFAHILNRYKVTKEIYEQWINECNNSCMICGKKPHEGKKLHLDHNHVTGEARGLLCTRCNWYLHTIEKDPTVLDKIKKYLKYE